MSGLSRAVEFFASTNGDPARIGAVVEKIGTATLVSELLKVSGSQAADLAYTALAAIPDLTTEQRYSLIRKLDSRNVFHALANIENLSSYERSTLTGVTSPYYAYRCLLHLKHLTSDERTRLIDNTDAYYAFHTLAGAKTLTQPERTRVIARIDAEYAHLALSDVEGLSLQDRRDLEAKCYELGRNKNSFFAWLRRLIHRIG